MRCPELQGNRTEGVTPVTRGSVIGFTRASAYEESGDPCDACDTRDVGVPPAAPEVGFGPQNPSRNTAEIGRVVTISVTDIRKSLSDKRDPQVCGPTVAMRNSVRGVCNGREVNELQGMRR